MLLLLLVGLQRGQGGGERCPSIVDAGADPAVNL